MTTDINAIMSLAYTKLLKRDEDGEFVASIAEFPGCSAHGATEAEALEFLSEVMSAWIEERLAAGQDVPTPQQDEDLPSGKWVQRVSRSLHHALIGLAKAEGVSLNQLVTTVLAEATARRRAIPVQAAGTETVGAHFANHVLGHHYPHQQFIEGSFASWTCIGGAETPVERINIALMAGKIIAKKGRSRLPSKDILELEEAHGR